MNENRKLMRTDVVIDGNDDAGDGMPVILPWKLSYYEYNCVHTYE